MLLIAIWRLPGPYVTMPQTPKLSLTTVYTKALLLVRETSLRNWSASGQHIVRQQCCHSIWSLQWRIFIIWSWIKNNFILLDLNLWASNKSRLPPIIWRRSAGASVKILHRRSFTDLAHRHWVNCFDVHQIQWVLDKVNRVCPSML